MKLILMHQTKELHNYNKKMQMLLKETFKTVKKEIQMFNKDLMQYKQELIDKTHTINKPLEEMKKMQLLMKL